MPVLQIQLLGQFRLSYGDHPVTGLDSPRLQEMLAFLVLHSDSPLSRQRLAFLLWPDSTEPQAHTNLRNLYHRLRQALPDSDRFLQASASGLGWQPHSSFTLDVAEFESGLERATNAEDLGAAVRLYRGELLPGCYSDWILGERERLRLEFVQALARLVDLQSERQDYRAAIGYAQELLRFDPLREESYRELMRLSGLNGDRAGVARFFSKCKTVLRRELDVEPSPETQSAYVQSLVEAGASRAASGPAALPSPGRRHNLPLQLSRFFGREQELTSLKRLVMEHRLITLTGTAGVGKTRLALAVAEREVESFPDGVWAVDLAPLTDPAQAAPALASALGVREMPGESLNERLGDYVRGRKLLILLDNCEHLVRAAAGLVEICLRASPESRIMATSREVLGIEGEQVWRVQPLPLPDSILYDPGGTGHGMARIPGERIVSRLLECPSVQLFVDRASTTLPSFVLSNENAPAVAQICRRLDGIPLAIELAAGRVNIMTAEEIRARLDNAIGLLAGGSPLVLLHHRTLRAALDWSYEALTEKEQRLLRRLAVFVGGFTIQAAEQVTSDPALPLSEVLELLSGLTDKSIVTFVVRGGETRLRLLEPIRQYAQEKLVAAGEEQEIQARHLGFFLRLAEDLDARAWGGGQPGALEPLGQEHDNFRSALSWAATADPQSGLRLAASLTFFWQWLGHASEGRNWLDRLLSLNAPTPPQLRARALFAAGGVAFIQADTAAARSHLESSLRLYRELGDEFAVANVLNKMGVLVASTGELPLARSMLEESLAILQAQGDMGERIFALVHLGFVHYLSGDGSLGRSVLEEGLALGREHGATGLASLAQVFLGHLARGEGDLALARSFYRGALTLGKESGVQLDVMYALQSLAVLGVFERRFERAAQLHAAAAKIAHATGMMMVPFVQGEYERAIDLARVTLGEAHFATAWAEGNAMSQEEALELAFS